MKVLLIWKNRGHLVTRRFFFGSSTIIYPIIFVSAKVKKTNRARVKKTNRQDKEGRW